MIHVKQKFSCEQTYNFDYSIIYNINHVSAIVVIQVYLLLITQFIIQLSNIY